MIVHTPRQNRVAPDGSLHAVSDRGTLIGNRGIIHDPVSRTLTGRRWTTPAWIACALHFRGRQRSVMSSRSWTELFFLDEVTALAAGHRPCFECRRPDATAFAQCLANALGRDRLRARDIDGRLHDERWLSTRKEKQMAGKWDDLPDGTMVENSGEFYAVCAGRLLHWRFAGYQQAESGSSGFRLVTPPAIICALQAGYRPKWHESAGLPGE